MKLTMYIHSVYVLGSPCHPALYTQSRNTNTDIRSDTYCLFNVYNGEMFQAEPRRNIARRFMRWWYNIDGKTSNTQCREVAKAVPVGMRRVLRPFFLIFKHVWCVQLANGLCYKLRQLLHNDIRVRKRR